MAAVLLTTAAALFAFDAGSRDPDRGDGDAPAANTDTAEGGSADAADERSSDERGGTLDLPDEGDLEALDESRRRSDVGAASIGDERSPDQLDIAPGALAGVRVIVTTAPVPAPGSKVAQRRVGRIQVTCRRGPARTRFAEHRRETELARTLARELRSFGATSTYVLAPRGCIDVEHARALGRGDVAIVVGAASGGGWRVSEAVRTSAAAPEATHAASQRDLVTAISTALRRGAGERAAQAAHGERSRSALQRAVSSGGAVVIPATDSPVAFVAAGDASVGTDRAVLDDAERRAHFARMVVAGVVAWVDAPD